MRCIPVVAAALAVACTAPQDAPRTDGPVVAPPPPGPPPASAVTLPAAPPPPAAPEVTQTPPPAAPLLAGPDRYQLPAKVQCDEHEPGPFCGVHVIDLAGGEITTLLTRDHKAWVVRAGKTETPTAVEFVALPRPPDQLERAEPLFRAGPGAFVSVRPPHTILPETFMLPDLRSLSGDFVLLGDKLYADGLVSESTVVEIDPKAKSFRALELAGKTTLAVLPGGPHLALYLSGKRRKSVATFDVAAAKIVAELEVPRDLEPECRRTHHHYDEEQAAFVAASGRFYVGFSCFPDA